MARETEQVQTPGKTSYKNLSRREKLQDVLKEDSKDTCLSCKITGATAFTGLGAYSYFSGKKQLNLREAAIKKSGSRFGMQSRQAGITGIALTFVGMGIWRLIH